MSRLNLQQLDLQSPPSPHFQQNYSSHHFHQPQIGSVPVVPHIMPNNGDLSSNSLQNPAVGSAVTSQPVPTSPTTPAPPYPSISVSLNTNSTQIPPPTRTIHNNDLNDAQNISKILQSSIHNGTNSTITTNHTNNNNTNNNNNNNNSDSKRLFLEEVSSAQINHKEERPNNDKNHHRSKRKPAQPKVTEKPELPKTPKKQAEKKHIHTNGLIDNKKPNNTITNGSSEDAAVEDELLDKIKNDNMETRSLVFREIRKLGRDYSGLYEQLGKVKGLFEMRFNFIKMCIEEASRFRRKHMADCIQEWWATRCDGTIAEQTGKKQKKT